MIAVTAAGGNPGVWGTPVWQCPADTALQLADVSWLMEAFQVSLVLQHS